MPSRLQRAFTLFEVMAAVVILALAFTPLAERGITGVRLEGEADRQLRASLLADRVLADLEVQISQGVAPEVGVSEAEEDEFLVRIQVEPFALELEDDSSVNPADPREGPTLLAPPARNQAPPLLSVQVSVVWQDVYFERSVARNTFAFDPAAVEAIAGEAGLQLGGSSEGDTPDDGDDSLGNDPSQGGRNLIQGP